MLSAIAIDDEPHALEVVKLHAAKVPFIQLRATFTDAFEAIDYLKKNETDLIFLDVRMPDISGIEFLGILPNPPAVIFTTAYSEYAVKGFELDAVDYLMKPFSLARFTKACHKAFELRQPDRRGQPEFFFLKTGYEEEKVMYKDILYIKADRNYTEYFLQDGRKLVSRQSISDAAEILPADVFVRVHRSYIVAVGKISKIGRHSVWVGDTCFDIGVSFENNLLKIREKLSGRDN